MTSDQFSAALHSWQSFYNMLGESAATLTGLMFVAASLGAHLLAEADDPKVRTFITPTVLYFSFALLLSALMNMPTQTGAALSLQLAALGLVGAGYSLSHLPRLLKFHQSKRIEPQGWTWNLIMPLFACLWLVGAAVALSLGHGEALEVAAVGGILLVMVGIHNAWNATLTIVRLTPN